MQFLKVENGRAINLQHVLEIKYVDKGCRPFLKFNLQFNNPIRVYIDQASDELLERISEWNLANIKKQSTNGAKTGMETFSSKLSQGVEKLQHLKG